MPMVWSLSPQQIDFEERARTISLGITALGVVGALLYFLRAALLPLVVALALKHLLQPVIRLLSVRPLVCCGRVLLDQPVACADRVSGNARSRCGQCAQAVLRYACRAQLPRNAAILVAVLLAFAVLGLLAAIVADGVHLFAEHADMYASRVKDLIAYALGWIEYFTCGWTHTGCPPHNATANATHNGTSPADVAASELEKLLSRVPITDLVLAVAESLLETVSDLFVVCLFTIYLLLGDTSASNGASNGASSGRHGDGADTPSRVDEQILAYIKGKVALSLLIGITTWLTLFAIGLDLCLVFGILAFWLNFIPNVGAVIAVFLPMPLVVLDPAMPVASMVVAFALPFSVHMFVGNVLEPLVFGHSLELQPVVILLSLMIWGMLWGLTGMVLAVPMTAVLKLHLDAIDHPVATYIVRLLVGDHGAKATDGMPPPAHRAVEEDTAPLRGSRDDSAMETASRPLVASGPHDSLAPATGSDAA